MPGLSDPNGAAAASVYAAAAEVEATPGVLDAAIWVGYAWADEPRNRAVAVVTGSDLAAVSTGATRLAAGFWEARDDFAFGAPTDGLDGALDQALASSARPFLISDSGDNPTARGAGDVTWGLTQLLARPEFRTQDSPIVIYASIPGPSAIATAVAAGVGATVSVTAGAEVDDRHAGPVTFTGVVHSIHHRDPDAETEVVIRVGGVHAILTKAAQAQPAGPCHRGRDTQPRRRWALDRAHLGEVPTQRHWYGGKRSTSRPPADAYHHPPADHRGRRQHLTVVAMQGPQPDAQTSAAASESLTGTGGNGTYRSQSRAYKSESCLCPRMRR